jgi:phage FluMu gp28-like protein
MNQEGEQVVLDRNLEGLPSELPRGNELPEDHDPLADGILMQHQIDWIEDKSALKLAEKGRRTGITYAEALDDTIVAATSRADGGDNVFYIGDTKDKGREFIGYVAHFAKIVAKEMVSIEDFLFEDQQPDGTTKYISAFRVRFASGFRVEALSSNPANIRGLQGIVVIDEAAFHSDVRAVLDAVNALLIWMGRVRVISTHNGALNPFNELVEEANAGKNPFNVHHMPFGLAIENGLYKRVCYIKNIEYTAEGEAKWEADIRASYGVRQAAMRQELDAIPADAEGAALSRVQIENAMSADFNIIRLAKPDDFKNAPQHIREADIRDWCERELRPHLEKLDPFENHFVGEDFARSGDATVIMALAVDRGLTRRARLSVELHNMPFEQQKQILFYICDRLPNFSGGGLDAGGNGAYLAEVAAQKYGDLIYEIKFTVEWYRMNMPPYIDAIGEGSMLLCKDEDHVRDHQALQYVNGYIKVPDKFTYKGANGLGRHGDAAIAGALGFYASRQSYMVYDGYATEEKDMEGSAFADQTNIGDRALW